MIDLSSLIHLGIEKAQKDYIKWAGLGLGHSAEYLIVSNVAQSISILQNTNDIHSLFVEKSIEELAESDDLKNYSNLRKGRCDICIEDENNFSIIEVKNTLTSATHNSKKVKSIIDDIKRIELFIKNDNYIKECYVCFINANHIQDKNNNQNNRKHIKNKINTRLENFMNIIKSKFDNLKFKITKNNFIETTPDNKIWGWQSVVVKIKQ